VWQVGQETKQVIRISLTSSGATTVANHTLTFDVPWFLGPFSVEDKRKIEENDQEEWNTLETQRQEHTVKLQTTSAAGNRP